MRVIKAVITLAKCWFSHQFKWRLKSYIEKKKTSLISHARCFHSLDRANHLWRCSRLHSLRAVPQALVLSISVSLVKNRVWYGVKHCTGVRTVSWKYFMVESNCIWLLWKSTQAPFLSICDSFGFMWSSRPNETLINVLIDLDCELSSLKSG